MCAERRQHHKYLSHPTNPETRFFPPPRQQPTNPGDARSRSTPLRRAHGLTGRPREAVAAESTYQQSLQIRAGGPGWQRCNPRFATPVAFWYFSARRKVRPTRGTCRKGTTAPDLGQGVRGSAPPIQALIQHLPPTFAFGEVPTGDMFPANAPVTLWYFLAREKVRPTRKSSRKGTTKPVV